MKTAERKEGQGKKKATTIKEAHAAPVRDILHDVAGWSSRDKIDVIEGGISKQEFETVKKDLLGNIIKVAGRCTRNQMFDRLELISQSVDPAPNPEEELKRIQP